MSTPLYNMLSIYVVQTHIIPPVTGVASKWCQGGPPVAICPLRMDTGCDSEAVDGLHEYKGSSITEAFAGRSGKFKRNHAPVCDRSSRRARVLSRTSITEPAFWKNAAWFLVARDSGFYIDSILIPEWYTKQQQKQTCERKHFLEMWRRSLSEFCPSENHHLFVRT